MGSREKENFKVRQAVTGGYSIVANKQRLRYTSLRTSFEQTLRCVSIKTSDPQSETLYPISLGTQASGPSLPRDKTP